MDNFKEFHPVVQALTGGLFTWAVTALGATLVLLVRDVKQALMDSMAGFAAGVMIAASFWSLLAPAIELSKAHPIAVWFPPAVGFATGGAFLSLMDRILPHLHTGLPLERAEGRKSSWQRSMLLIMAITLHNIPEGLAVGVAFGAAAHGLPETSLAAALALTLGIGIQNFPEGMAVALPLRRENVSAWKCFVAGQASAWVEPIAAVIGAAAVIMVKPLLPYALSFAAGAMIFVVVEELIPESQRNDNTDLATLSALAGFMVMMILDTAFG